MRGFDKAKQIEKANLLAEQRYLEAKTIKEDMGEPEQRTGNLMDNFNSVVIGMRILRKQSEFAADVFESKFSISNHMRQVIEFGRQWDAMTSEEKRNMAEEMGIVDRSQYPADYRGDDEGQDERALKYGL